jgi:hypothetical protein
VSVAYVCEPLLGLVSPLEPCPVDTWVVSCWPRSLAGFRPWTATRPARLATHPCIATCRRRLLPSSNEREPPEFFLPSCWSSLHTKLAARTADNRSCMSNNLTPCDFREQGNNLFFLVRAYNNGVTKIKKITASWYFVHF